MKLDIILSGVGGQGILSIAAIIGEAALRKGLHVKQAEVHGMSQRGGDVQSNLRLSSSPIHSDLIPKGKAGAILALEPMEALRYLPYLSDGGWIVTNAAPVRQYFQLPRPYGSARYVAHAAPGDPDRRRCVGKREFGSPGREYGVARGRFGRAGVRCGAVGSCCGGFFRFKRRSDRRDEPVGFPVDGKLAGTSKLAAHAK